MCLPLSLCAVELKRLRADGEMAAVQSERERQTLKQELINTQQEAQLSLRNVLSDHQEELERLTNDKVSFCVVQYRTCDCSEAKVPNMSFFIYDKLFIYHLFIYIYTHTQWWPEFVKTKQKQS